MRNFIKVLPFIVLFLVIGACPQGPGFGPGGGKSITNVIEINFLPSRPPSSIYENSQFYIALEAKNFHDKQKDVYVCVFDDFTDYFGGVPSASCKVANLPPAQHFKEEIIPSTEKLYFPDQSGRYYYKNLEKDEDVKVTLRARYEHTTKATTTICLARDYDLGCEMVKTITPENFDGPVKVMSIKKEIIPLGDNQITLRLEIDIKNAGNGKVISSSDVSSLEVSEPFIDVSVNLQGITNKFNCEPKYQGKIKMINNAITLKCSTDIKLDQDYLENPLIVNVRYGYEIEKVINVKVLNK